MCGGLEVLQTLKHDIHRPCFLCRLAEAYGAAGCVGEGLATLDETQALVEKNKERLWQAELYRLRGEMLVAEPAARSDSEHFFNRAIDVARSQNAKSLELRAVMSLARLWRSQKKSRQARARLDDVYGWFTEGFDTVDLREARSLLEQMA